MKRTGHKRYLLIRLMVPVLILLFSQPFLFGQVDKFKFEREFDQTSQLIVMLSVEYAEETPTFGAGIIFGGDKDHLYIATADHVVHRGALQPKNILIKFRALPGKELKATVVKFDKDLDLAVLTITGLTSQGINGCAFPFDRLPMNADLERGDGVLPVGNPNGVSWAIPVDPDKISQINETQIVFQSTFISSGHSGGGLLDENGHLVGMTTADQPPFGRAINMNAVVQQVKKWGFAVRLTPTKFPFYRFSKLHGAVMNGDLVKLKDLLATCNNPNEIDEFFVTPLHLAAAYGQTDAMALLLKSGANLNAQNVIGD